MGETKEEALPLRHRDSLCGADYTKDLAPARKTDGESQHVFFTAQQGVSL